jgi:pilus assembly protein CpaE
MGGPPIRTLVAVDTGLNAREIADAIPNDAEIQTIGVVEGMDESWRTLQDSTVDVLIVACLGYSERALYLIDGAVKQDPTRPVIVLSHGSPNGFVRRVFDTGADDIVVWPQKSDDLRFAITKAVARRAGGAAAAGAGALGELICVLGPKGGSGKTLTSVNTGVALAQKGYRTVVVDLDLQFGDVGLTLGLSPNTTIHDLVTAGGTLDAAKVDDFLTVHESGLRVLLAPTRPDQASAVTISHIREIYSILRMSYDFVIVDTPPGFSPEVIATIDASTTLIVVGMLDSLSLKNTKLGLETLQLMGYRSDRIRLVLNRAQTKVGISRDDVVAVLGRTPHVYVPSDREVPRALSEGRAVVSSRPGSDTAAAFTTLASLLATESERTLAVAVDAGQEATETESQTGGQRRRLFGRKD